MSADDAARTADLHERGHRAFKVLGLVRGTDLHADAGQPCDDCGAYLVEVHGVDRAHELRKRPGQGKPLHCRIPNEPGGRQTSRRTL